MPSPARAAWRPTYPPRRYAATDWMPTPRRPGPVEREPRMPSIENITVPDIGDFADIPVIEILVKVGDTIAVDDSICTLESDKATMDVPSSAAGVVKEVLVKVGDKVGEGALLVKVESSGVKGEGGREKGEQPSAVPAPVPASPASAPTAASALANPSPSPLPPSLPLGSKAHASPSVRQFARTLGVDLGQVRGTGVKGRITQADVQTFVKGVLAQPASLAAAANRETGQVFDTLLPWPKVDFAKFGPVEAKPLSRIKKISGANLARNWVMIPHVTNFDEADVTDLEAFRVQMNKESEKSGAQGASAKLTMLAFLIKACVAGLKKYPEFNASLDGQGDEMRLVVKQYFHIGFAAD
ncbi:MAG: dihydrolipoamide acetyltransferase, partial [Rhodocyclaceae bacterium]